MAAILPALMMTENEKRLSFMFDDAMRLRDAGEFVAARHLLASLVEQLTQQDEVLLPHTHMQLGNISDMLGDHSQREAHFRAASVIAPRKELASLGLFHALWDQGRRTEALEEMVRFLRWRYSEMYAEMLSPRFEARLSAEQQALVGEARRLLARRRRN
jgi:hypothetical protein